MEIMRPGIRAIIEIYIWRLKRASNLREQDVGEERSWYGEVEREPKVRGLGSFQRNHLLI